MLSSRDFGPASPHLPRIRRFVAGVRNGAMTATVSPLPYWEGYWAVEAAVRLLEGQDVAPWVVAPAQLITADNVDEFYDADGQVLTDLFE